MSQQSQRSKFIVAMIGALVVVTATWSVRHPSDATRMRGGKRGPASVDRSMRLDQPKQSRLNEFANAEPIGKVSGSFSVAIRGDDGSGGALETKAEAAAHVRLVGTVTPDRVLSGHEYSWILPAGYRVSEGSISGKIPDLQPGQTFDVSITVDRDQTPLQPIVLHVFKLINSEARGQVAQFDIPDAKSVKETSERLSRTPEAERKYVQ